ncbi:cytochrome P450 [Imleria badia]|nr:cytochrome P450 [Imleria badia]
MFDWTTTGALVLGSVVVLYIGRRALGRRRSYPLLPGPPGLPWVGTVTGIDAGSPWITYASLVYSRLLGKDIIILSSEKIAKDLLENRSKNYSDRPYLITRDMWGLFCLVVMLLILFLCSMCGLGFLSVPLPYGDRWRSHRRFFHQTFRLEAVYRFLPSQHRKACKLLRRLLNAPEQLDVQVFEYTAAIIMNSTYDYDPASRKDELVDIVANMLSIVVPVIRPDVTLTLGAFPWFLYHPSWFPGMSFKREMATARELSREYLQRQFEYSLQKASSGSVAPSMVHDALREMEEKGTSPEESWMVGLKEAAGSVFLAASETSDLVLMTFFLMMVMNQGAQEKAQYCSEQEPVPTMVDRPLLPFVNAIFRETLRYNPIAPLSLPHAAVDDDMYGGLKIPHSKGRYPHSELVVSEFDMLSNLISIVRLGRAMAHDKSRYPDPHAFIPERFLNDDGSLISDDVEHIAYGLGRRICVGRHFADTSVWSVMVKVLAVFKILKPLGENGVEVPVEPLFSTGNSIFAQPSASVSVQDRAEGSGDER